MVILLSFEPPMEVLMFLYRLVNHAQETLPPWMCENCTGVQREMANEFVNF